MSDSQSQSQSQSQLLQSQAKTTSHLYTDPHNPHLHLTRAQIHAALNFPDLAAADAYRALSLLESVVEPEECEFLARRRVEPVSEGELGDAVAAAFAGAAVSLSKDDDDDGEDDEEEEEKEEEDENDETFTPITKQEYTTLIGPVYELLVRSLINCACFRDAFEFCSRGINLFHELGMGDSTLVSFMDFIKRIYAEKRRRFVEWIGKMDEHEDEKEEVDPRLLNGQGLARRVLYPWNEHEPDRKAPETVDLLNERIKKVAPKCEVKAVALPALHGHGQDDDSGEKNVSIQLGLFAKEDLAPNEIILRETSLLTATNKLHDDICDACNSPLPDLSADQPPIPCDNCEDTFFCSRQCHDQAQEIYHAGICGRESIASIGRSNIQDPKDKPDYLYFLLLGRAIAMAVTQGIHPLELPEVKYIWGDFHPSPSPSTTMPKNEEKKQATLPFSFTLTILQPTRLLEEMGLDPFTALPFFDTWVLNTLYAKFRGTASGRLSTWDGGPEVCAVHPLWCLANHSCDPNVRWEWGGEIMFRVREAAERVVWERPDGERRCGPGAADGGIRKGEEIRNHYCDVALGVKERREWASGALGGLCLCERCIWEDSIA